MAVALKADKPKKSKKDRRIKDRQQVQAVSDIQSEMASEQTGKLPTATPRVVVDLPIKSLLSGLFLVDTTVKEEGYVGMLVGLAKSGDILPPLLTDVGKNKFSDFIDSVIAGVEPQLEVAVSSADAPKRESTPRQTGMQVTFL